MNEKFRNKIEIECLIQLFYFAFFVFFFIIAWRESENDNEECV